MTRMGVFSKPVIDALRLPTVSPLMTRAPLAQEQMPVHRSQPVTALGL